MRLYSGTAKSLIEDSTFNRIAPKLKEATAENIMVIVGEAHRAGVTT